MRSIYVKLRLPLEGKKLSWSRDLHIREEQRVLKLQNTEEHLKSGYNIAGIIIEILT